MIRRPPRSTRTDTLFPYTTLFRSHGGVRRGFLGGRSAVWRPRDPDGLETAFALPIGESFDGGRQHPDRPGRFGMVGRSEEHTSELQSLMRTSYAVFCLKKKTHNAKVQHC